MTACHKMIAETAKQMAFELYDTLMQDNNWYALWKGQNPRLSPESLAKRFVARNWGQLVPSARATLVEMLRRPLDEALKEEISQALILDNSLKFKKQRNRAIH